MISRIAARPAKKRCNQCWLELPRAEFVGADGRERAKNCNGCRGKYRGWNKKSAAEKLDTRAPRKDAPSTGRVVFVASSMNRKLGAIPVSYSERGTCPPSCMFYEAGCYAENGKDGAHWRGVSTRGLEWNDFIERVRALPVATLWRHNEAGDLAGAGDVIDSEMLEELAAANVGRRGFTFTHKPVIPTHRFATTLAHAENVYALELAQAHGFVVNLSADSLEEADDKADLDVGPVVVTVPVGEQLPARTPGGRKLVACPAQTHAMTCADCQLCAKGDRKSIVVFRAHGQSAGLVSELVKRKRQRTEAA
jgi:hypothetical protein